MMSLISLMSLTSLTKKPPPPRVNTIFHSRDLKSAKSASDVFLGSIDEGMGMGMGMRLVTHKIKSKEGSLPDCHDYWMNAVITAEFRIVGETYEQGYFAALEQVLFDLLSTQATFCSDIQRVVRFIVPARPPDIFCVLVQRAVEKHPMTLFVLVVSNLMHVSPRSRFHQVGIKSPARVPDEFLLDIIARFLKQVEPSVRNANWGNVFSVVHVASFKLCGTAITIDMVCHAIVDYFSRIEYSNMTKVIRLCAMVSSQKINKISLLFDFILMQLVEIANES